MTPHDPLRPLNGSDDGWLDFVRAAERPRAGSQLGEYEVLEEVRHGGQGLVFRARQPHTGRLVALKRVAAGRFANASERRRFEREIELSCLLEHPGIVTVYGVEQQGDLPLLAMEWVEGEPFDVWAAARPPGTAGLHDKLNGLLAVCEAVAYAHGRGVIHRDLKPSNVLVDRQGRPRVLDFGLARRIETDAADPTLTRGFVGTPAYAPPEAFGDGELVLDARSDVFALGVMTYEMLVGHRPFRAPSLRRLITEIEELAPTPPSRIASGLDRELDAIVGCAIAKDPARRYQTAHAMAEDLRRYLSGRPVAAVPPRASYLITKWIARNRALAAVLLVAFASIVGWVVHSRSQAETIRDERDTARNALGEAEAERERAAAANRELETALADARRQERRMRGVRDFYLDAVFLRGSAYSKQRSTRLEDVIRDAVELANNRFAEDEDLLLEIQTYFARSLARFGMPKESLELARAMVELHDRSPQPVWVTRAVLGVAMAEAHSALREPEAALAAMRRSWRDLQQLDDPEEFPITCVLVLMCLGSCELHYGDRERSLEHFERAIPLARQHPAALHLEAQTVDAYLMALHRLGDVARGRQWIDAITVDERYRTATLARVLARVAFTRVEQQVAQSEFADLAESWRCFAAAARLLPAGDRKHWPGLCEHVARQLLAADADATARTGFELALEFEPPNELRRAATGGLAIATASLGDCAAAIELAERALQLARGAAGTAGRFAAALDQLAVVQLCGATAEPALTTCRNELAAMVAAETEPTKELLQRWFDLAERSGCGDAARTSWAERSR